MGLLGDQVSNSLGVRVGFEHRPGSKHAYGADIMSVFPCKTCGQAYARVKSEMTVGVLVSAEYRNYLFTGKTSCDGFHLGPRLAYQFTVSELNETLGSNIQNAYDVKRHMVTAHMMAGYQLQVTGPLYLDPSLGLGIRYISSRSPDKKGTDPGQKEFPYNKDFESGRKFFPSVDISIALGLKI
jgi:hypothetical protein